jgi:DNA-binding beta-propeller fold protein YncE
MVGGKIKMGALSNIGISGRRFTTLAFFLLLATPALIAFAVLTIRSASSNTTAIDARSLLYIQEQDHIAVLDNRTGERIHDIPLDGEFTNVFLAVAPQTGRLIISNDVELLTYRTANWSIEHRITTPNLINYPGYGFSGIAPSTDGKYLYVYKYLVKMPSGADYWLSTLDLDNTNWLPQKVDLPNCGASQLFPGGPDRLYVLCYGSQDVRVIDTINQKILQSITVNAIQQSSGWTITGAASGTILNGTIYVVTDNREVHIKNPNTSQLDRVLTTASSTVQQIAPNRVVASKIVPFQPVGIDLRDRTLFVPTGTPDERSTGLASEIAFIDTVSGNVQRTLRPSQPFRWIAFSSDGSAAFILLSTSQVIYGDQLIRIDLQTGAETILVRSSRLYPGFIVSP